MSPQGIVPHWLPPPTVFPERSLRAILTLVFMVFQCLLAHLCRCLPSWPEDSLQKCHDGFEEPEVAFDTAFESPKIVPRVCPRDPRLFETFLQCTKKQRVALVCTQIIGQPAGTAHCTTFEHRPPLAGHRQRIFPKRSVCEGNPPSATLVRRPVLQPQRAARPPRACHHRSNMFRPYARRQVRCRMVSIVLSVTTTAGPLGLLSCRVNEHDALPHAHLVFWDSAQGGTPWQGTRRHACETPLPTSLCVVSNVLVPNLQCSKMHYFQ